MRRSVWIHGCVVVGAVMGLATPPAHAVLIDVSYDGTVFSNAITVGPYAGIAPGTPVRLTVRVDSTIIFSDEPENVRRIYQIDHTQAFFTVQGAPTFNGRPNPVASDSTLWFAGGDDYYQLEAPGIVLDVAQTTFLSAQFDGFGSNPFNNTGHIEENLGTYSAEVFDSLQSFNVSVAHPGPVFRGMVLFASTFTIAPANVGVCGDGEFNAGEECDDGNSINGDGCSATCTVEPACGNYRLDPGESCDDGNVAGGDGCDGQCLLECGNGALDPGEQCDDGNVVSGDGCSRLCRHESICGNNRLDFGEECDDGNLVGGDGCSAQCRRECGNGALGVGEACDDGNRLNGDGCDDQCRIEAVCGNGAVEPGEQCDDGNVGGGDGCSAGCDFEVACGNGRIDLGEQCDDGGTAAGDGCSAACTLESIDGLCVGAETEKLIAPAGTWGDLELDRGIGYGYASAVDGDRMLIGARYVAESLFVDPVGAVFAYARIGGAWILQQELRSPDGGFEFGTAVALDGNVAAVACAGCFATYDLDVAAKVYVLQDDGDGWMPVAELEPGAAEVSTQLSPLFIPRRHGMALSGDTVLVGMPNYSPAGVPGGALVGGAFVYRQVGGAWSTEQRLIAPDPQFGVDFGTAVALDADLAVVSAPDLAAVYIFRRTGSAWAHERKLTHAGLRGTVVAASGDTIAVDGASGVLVFRRVGADWVIEDTLTPAAGVAATGFGLSLALDGDTLVVGAPGDDVAAAEGGAGYIYRRFGHDWVESAHVTAFDAAADDQMGWHVALRDDQVVLGADRFDTGAMGGNEGAAFTYLLDPALEDCDSNGVHDACDLLTAPDCNRNRALDACDLNGGASSDCQGDGVPDECQLANPPVDVLQDGAFEMPGLAVWYQESTNFGTPLCHIVFCGEDPSGTFVPHFGLGWAIFGGIDAPETGSLDQLVTLPADSSLMLHFQLRISSASGNGSDYVRVAVDDEVVWEALENTTGHADYAPVEVDLSAYADGREHRLTFASTISGVPFGSVFLVDSIALVARPRGDDCNRNGVPDGCDLAAATSPDCQGDNQPDECQLGLAPAGNRLNNGSFESGNDGQWATASTNLGSPVCNQFCSSSGNNLARFGSFYLWFGGCSPGGCSLPEIATAEQSLLLPENADATLRFHVRILAGSGNGQDYLRAFVDGAEVFEVLENAAGFSVYTPVQLDLGAYADGLTHTIKFEGAQLGEGNTSILIDDVAVHVSAPAPNDVDTNGVPDECAVVPGDFDGDGDVDLADHAAFVDCLFGPGVGPTPTPPATAADCLRVFDANGDQDVDLEDFANLTRVFGP